MSKKKLITFLVCLTMSLGAAGTMASCDFLGGGSSESVSEESSIEESTPEESDPDESDPEESDPEESDSEESDPEESDSDESDSEEPPVAEEATVTFEGVDVAIDAQTIVVGEKVEKPADPVKEYYNFDGWYNGETKWDFENDVVEGDLALTAKFTAKVYVVTFVDFDNVETEVTYTVENVADFAMPTVPAAPENCNNARWSLALEECTVFAEEGIIVYALCDANVYYDVTFVNGDESTTISVGENLLINQKPADPVKDYYTFDGWYNGETKWDFTADKVNENVTLTAKYVAKTYSVKFVDVNGDEVAVKEYTVENVADFEAPEVPAAPQYFTNGAWDKAAADYLVYSEEAVEVKAVYERITYTVSFVDGDTVVEMTVGADLLVEEAPADPIKAYYNFDGWYNGETKWNFTADKVYENVTLTAKYVAIEYTVAFVDFDGEVTEVSYNVENAADFAMPAVSAAPEHYENARWNKTVEECLVYSDAVIVVEAICDAKTYMVSFENCDMEAVGVVYGNTLTVAAPTMSGYAFKCWNLNGEAYDMNAIVDGDITLTATWYVEQSEDVKSVMSATEIYNSLQFEAGYGWQEGGVEANPNKGWYFDSDYNGYTGAGGVEENKFAELAHCVLSVDGGSGNDANGRMTYIVLPAINYSMYSKVDFVYLVSSKMKSVEIYGVNVSQYGGNNKMVSIRTDENGTKLYFAEINSAGTADFPQAIIDLPAEVVNGQVGLQLDISVTDWMKFTMTELHMTSKYLDYSADLAGITSKLPAENELTGSAAEYDAVMAYINAMNYMTDYEKASFEIAPIVKVAGDKAIYNKIAAANNGSAEQLALIDEYKAFSELLTEEEKATEWHQLNVAAINAIIDTHFAYSTTTVITDNVATATFGGEIAAPTVEASASQFKGVYGSFSYMTGDPTAPTMFTMKVFDYSAYDEVEFGVAFAVTAERGILNICGETYSIPESLIGHWYKMKAVIADGYLTLVDAGSSNDVKTKDTNYAQYGYFFKVALPENVLNGNEGMTIGIDTAKSWMWFEVTEMNATSSTMTVETIISNVVASATVGGEPNVPAIESSASKHKGKVETFSYMTGNPTVPAIFTLNKVNYASYDEVRFYVAMAVTGDRGVLNVCGETYRIPDSLIGHWYYMEAVIKNGYLTLIDAGSHNDVKTRDTNYLQYGYFFKVALSEDVLNGKEALTIGVETSPAYMWFEVTEMTTVKAIKHVS